MQRAFVNARVGRRAKLKELKAELNEERDARPWKIAFEVVDRKGVFAD